MLLLTWVLKMIFGEKMKSEILSYPFNPALHRVKLNNSSQWIWHNERRHYIWFINTPKNATTTIRKYWEIHPELKPDASQYDMPALMHGSSWQDQPYKICVILRDPVARHLSATAMLVEEVQHIYGITGLDPSDFHDLHTVRDIHLVPQWAFVPLCMPPMDQVKELMMRDNLPDGHKQYDWNDLYRDVMASGFENLINEHYDFFWMSEDPEKNVWVDICKHYDMPLMDKKENTNYQPDGHSRKDEPIKNLSKMITSVHSAYACDYDFHHRASGSGAPGHGYRNTYLEKR